MHLLIDRKCGAPLAQRSLDGTLTNKAGFLQARLWFLKVQAAPQIAKKTGLQYEHKVVYNQLIAVAQHPSRQAPRHPHDA